MSAESKPRKKTPSAAPFIDRGEPLPRSYGENRVVAMICDPEHLFGYWDIESEVRVAGCPLLIRVHCLSESRSYDFEPGPDADNWHLRVTPNRTYRLDLYARTAPGKLRQLASSNEATTPVRWAGESGAEPPAEMIHAERHVLARGVKRPARMAEAAAAAAAAGAPPSPPPVPVPTPFVKVFAAEYSHGKGR